MIWSDRDIHTAIIEGDIGVYPEPDLLGPALQPASLELRVAEDIYLPGGMFRLTHTLETVNLGRTVAAQLNGKSSWARKGLLVHSTGGWIDPGFIGQIVLGLKNLQPHPLEIAKGTPLCQLVFHPLSSRCMRPYGHRDLQSHYQSQEGTRRSHLDNSDA